MLVPLVMWLGFAECVELPKTLVLTGTALAAFLAVLAHPARRAALYSHPLAAPLLLLSASAIASALLSVSPRVAWAGEDGSWKGAAALSTVWLGALAAGALAGPGSARKWCASVVAASVLLLAYAFLQAGGFDPVPWDPAVKGYYWVMATLGNPVHLGNILAAAFALTFALWRTSSVPAWVLRALLLAGVLMTKSRSAIVALAGGALVYLAQRRVRSPGVLLMAAAPAAVPPLLDSLSRLFELTRLAGARPFLWEGALRLLASHPLLGVGPDMFYSWFPSVAPYGFFSAEPPVISGDNISVRLPASAHAELVNIAVSQGIVGLVAYGWAVWAVVRTGARSPLLPALAVLLLAHQANPPSVATSFLFWALAAHSTRFPGSGGPLAPASRLERRSLRAEAAGWILGTVGAAVLAASLWTSLMQGVAQAHRREVKRLFFFGRAAEVPSHMERWAGWAARRHPRQAYDDAMVLKTLGEIGRKPALGMQAVAFMAGAVAANPRNVFFVSGEAELELALGKSGKEAGRMARAESLFHSALALAPSTYSLHDDLARVYDAMGKRGEASTERALRKKLDTAGLFAPKPGKK